MPTSSGQAGTRPEDETPPETQFDDMDQQRHAGLLGMWVFLLTELLLFGGLFAAFAILRLQYANVFAEAAHHLDLKLAAINTALLLSSGLTMMLAELAAGARLRKVAVYWLLATILLGLAFLAIKGFEWYSEFRHQLMPVLVLPFRYPGEQPAIAELFFNLYFIATGLHAVHMLVGIAILVVMLALVRRWRRPDRLDRQLHIAGLYWAFIDVVWVFIFTLFYLLRG
ncbi:cytochrome c oxidase subunit 3 [Microbulbifer rhizosphaerae]|uniref:Cytochrome c oxidase subunit 3 n=1 Tax=Microbulbifer rhizosphaerae TaxID=1562603 RepID=A0A7W4Z8E2_9GAMM|nr:cytochrome c oxidase subunit 3 [Microbulbifer rhizosphaerae]MBB3060492.1 cytochrome c oxidase subunit 3 [Microbulbifer rhizosphaerae]